MALACTLSLLRQGISSVYAVVCEFYQLNWKQTRFSLPSQVILWLENFQGGFAILCQKCYGFLCQSSLRFQLSKPLLIRYNCCFVCSYHWSKLYYRRRLYFLFISYQMPFRIIKCSSWLLPLERQQFVGLLALKHFAQPHRTYSQFPPHSWLQLKV